MADKVGPAIPQNIRFPQDLYELIQKKCDKERKTFTEVVLERVILTFEEDWDYTGKLIRLANHKMEKWHAFKLRQKKIRHKEIYSRKVAKLELNEKRRKRKEKETLQQYQNHCTSIKLIKDHLEGRVSIWVNNTDPNDWLVGDTQPEENFRKLPKGELNTELLDYYNKNVSSL